MEPSVLAVETPSERHSFSRSQYHTDCRFVRSSWGNKAPAVKPDQVKKVRDATKDWGDSAMSVPELEKVTLVP